MASPAGPVDASPDRAPANATSPQTPPEKPSDIRRRSYIVLSFWFLVVLLGLPVWWQTTSIYRADLPLAEMMDWADGKVGILGYTALLGCFVNIDCSLGM